MSVTIYSCKDSNMAGQEWRWSFKLERAPDGTFTINAKQDLIDPDEGDEVLEIEPVVGLATGADIYEALCSMVSNEFLNDDPTSLDNEQIGAEIAQFDKAIADQYLLEVRAIEEDEADVILPSGLAVSDRRLSKAEEMELYRKLDAAAILICHSRSEPLPDENGKG